MRVPEPPAAPSDHRVRHARRILAGVLVALTAVLALVGLSEVSPAVPPSAPERDSPSMEPIVLVGVASWYGEAFRDRTTACGEPYDPDALTAAHRTLPCWARLRVEHGSRSVVVTITDRGPYVDGRELDLSRAAFERLAPREQGLIDVRVTVLTP